MGGRCRAFGHRRPSDRRAFGRRHRPPLDERERRWVLFGLIGIERSKGRRRTLMETGDRARRKEEEKKKKKVFYLG